MIYSENDTRIKRIKEQYPEGTRIKLIHMDDPYCPVPDGTLGTVSMVDDIGTIHMRWDNGSSLGLVVGEDEFEVVRREKA